MIFNYWNEFLGLALVHFLIVISPGPDFAITLRQSIRFGRKAGIYTALGIGAGISVHVIYTLIGVSALMHTSAWLMNIAKFIGCAYLVYLGINFLRSKPQDLSQVLNSQKDMQAQTGRHAFWMGFMTNATNPKAMLFFLAIFTTLVSESTPISIKLFYAIWMCLVNAAWFMSISLLFSSAAVRNKFLSHSHIFERIMGGVLLLFAGRLLFASL